MKLDLLGDRTPASLNVQGVKRHPRLDCRVELERHNYQFECGFYMQALKLLVLIHIAAWLYGAASLSWISFQAESYFVSAASAGVGGIFLLDLLSKAADVVAMDETRPAKAQMPLVYLCQSAAGLLAAVSAVQAPLPLHALMALAMITASAFAVAAWQLLVGRTGLSEER